jgi:hypothetical protein
MKHTSARSLGLAVLLGSTAWGQVTQRMSVSTGGVEGDNNSIFAATPSARYISNDGRFVAFTSDATNLVPGDTNQRSDVFVHDRLTGTTECVSVTPSGTPGDLDSYNVSISADGRFVAFTSAADDLVPNDTNATQDIFVRDRQLGTTERVSVASNGAQGTSGGDSVPSISADGNLVAFGSFSDNLVAGDTNGTWDVFVRDRQMGTTERVSVDSNGVEANDISYGPAISADGRFVAFPSKATNLVLGDANGKCDVFVHDRQTGATERVSVATGGAEGDDHSGLEVNEQTGIAISGDGRYVAFGSTATNLVAGDTNQLVDVFVHDRATGVTERVSVGPGGVEANERSSAPSLDDSGRFVGMYSYASNFVNGDTNVDGDVFVRDLSNGTIERVSVATDGTEGNLQSFGPSVSSDGRFVAFGSSATTLVNGDTNGFGDTFIRDRAATGFTSLCNPGVGGIIACPCANPPSGGDRGCDNSAGTGGASLSATGIAYVSMDSLVFTTNGERPTALSILVQYNSLLAIGTVYGQGVRCAGGTTLGLFVGHAVAGSFNAPNFGAGDPSVSARSAAKGDVIQAGQSRWYLVVYRDPTVLGGCPPDSTFNSTQTGQIGWSL